MSKAHRGNLGKEHPRVEEYLSARDRQIQTFLRRLEFVIFDFETTGLIKETDQPLQASFMRTDSNLEEVKRLDRHILLNSYNLPGPEALMVTRVPMADLYSEDRISEFQAAQEVHDFLNEGPSLAASNQVLTGYSSGNFDEEVLRFFLFRNLQDPFVASKHNTRRLDLLPVILFLSKLRPDVLKCGKGEDGSESFKLSHVAEANGVDPSGAHDAEIDNEMVRGLLRIILEKAPDVLYGFILNSNKKEIDHKLQQATLGEGYLMGAGSHWDRELHPLCPATTMDSRGAKTMFVDVSQHLKWVERDTDELVEEIFMRKEVSPFKIMRNTSCPMLFEENDPMLGRSPYSEEERQLHRDRAQVVMKRAGRYQKKLREIVEAVAQREARLFGGVHLTHEGRIYDGFPDRDDKDLARRFCKADKWEKRIEIVQQMKDPRHIEFANRIIAQYAPDELVTQDSLEALKRACELRLSTDAEAGKEVKTLAGARQELEALPEGDEKTAIAEDLDMREQMFQAFISDMGQSPAIDM